MIKNIILDVGGVFFDDSKENIRKLLNTENDNFYKQAYGAGFNKCLVGESTIPEVINNLKSEENFKELEYILNPNNLINSYPIIKENFEYIKRLKERGYNLYLLTNITEASHNYINNQINIDSIFDGGIYSYQEHIVKPNPDIYNLILNRFNLSKDETIFFDDREKNVLAANEVGLKAVVFKSIEDIENNLK